MIPTTMSLWSGARNISTSHTFTPITFCNCKLVCCKYKWKNINGTLNLLLQFLKITFSQFPGPRLLAAAWCWWCVTVWPLVLSSCCLVSKHGTWQCWQRWQGGHMHTRWHASCLQSQTEPAPQLDWETFHLNRKCWEHPWRHECGSAVRWGRAQLLSPRSVLGLTTGEVQLDTSHAPAQTTQPCPGQHYPKVLVWPRNISSGSCGFGRRFFTQGWLLCYKSK